MHVDQILGALSAGNSCGRRAAMCPTPPEPRSAALVLLRRGEVEEPGQGLTIRERERTAGARASASLGLCVPIQGGSPHPCDQPAHGTAVQQQQQGLVPGAGVGVDPLDMQPAASACCWRDPDDPPASPSVAAPRPSNGSRQAPTSRSALPPRTASRDCSREPPPRCPHWHVVRTSSHPACGSRSAAAGL